MSNVIEAAEAFERHEAKAHRGYRLVMNQTCLRPV